MLLLETFFSQHYNELISKIKAVDMSVLKFCVKKIQSVKKNSGKVIVVGNGGSAAIASHFSVDLNKTYGIRCLNFNEGAFLTCFSNDFGYQNWVVEALRIYLDQSDFVVLISSSGESQNIVNAISFLKKSNVDFVTLTGFKKNSTVKSLSDFNMYVESNHYNIVENTHQVWLLSIIDYLVAKIQKS